MKFHNTNECEGIVRIKGVGFDDESLGFRLMKLKDGRSFVFEASLLCV